MSKTVQWKRGNTAQNSTYIGAQGEITVNTTNYTLVVHDGVTAGGYGVTSNVQYTMGNINQWTANVYTVAAALDQLAARVWALENP